MTFFQANKGTVYAIAILGLSAPAFLTGCYQGGGGSTTYGTTGSRYSEPSGGGATVAEERPGAGVGAQTSVGAAADVPEATQKGAGASDLTTPNQSGSSSQAQAGSGQTQGAGGSTITDAATLTGAQDPNTLAGRQARLSNLTVQQVLDQHFIQVSDRSGKPFYVYVTQPVQNLKQGDTVSLSGTVNRVPADTTNLGLSDQASQALADQSIYLDAQQLQVTGH